MQKLSGLRRLEGFRSLADSTSMAMKAANPKPSYAGGGSYGTFANLKITAEKLVEEQASVKTDLEMAHTKLRRSTEQINLLEGKLQQAVNENAKFKVKQNEDSKLWQGLDSKISSTKTLCDQLAETLQQLSSQTDQAEEDKFFEEMLGKNWKALDEFNCLLHDLSKKLECAEQKIISGKQEMLQIKQEKEEMDPSYKEQLYSNDDTLIGQAIEHLDREQTSVNKYTEMMDSLIKKLDASVDKNKDSKLWKGLDSKISSAKTLCDQLTETPQKLASQTEQVEEDKKFFEEVLGKNFKTLDYFNCLLHDLSTKLECAEQKMNSDKLIREKFSVSRKLEMEHSKVRIAVEGTNILERILQQAVNENTKLKVKQNEDSKLCQGLDSKLSSAKTLCDQLTKTLQQLTSQTEQVEDDKKFFEEMLGRNSKALDKFNCLLHDLSTKLKCAEQKIISEKLVKEQASVKTELEMAHTKLRRATEQISLLEGKLQQAVNENAKLKVKQNEDSKLLLGLDSKISSTKTLCDQLTETLQELASQTEQAEEDEKFSEEMLGKNSKDLDEFNCLLHDLSAKLECAEQKIISGKQEVLQIKQEKEEMDQSYKEQLYSNNDTMIGRENFDRGQASVNRDMMDYFIKKLDASIDKYDLVAEIKQIDLQKYLKEISLKNGQVITAFCKYYGLEKIEITNAENQKSMENRFDEKTSKLMSCSLHCKKEHGRMVPRIQQDNEHKESTLWAYHKEELQHIQSHAENDLRKEYSVSSMKRGDSYGRKEHEVQLLTNIMRSIHNTPYMGNSKKTKETSNQNYPGNKATVVLNRNDLRASQRSFKIGIRKARAWCRSKSKRIDLSAYFGPGAEVFTTPATGTFHLSFEYDNRRLTLFIYGRDLYVKGWESDSYGLFEIVKNFIPDPACKFLDTGVNYNHICKSGEVAKIRIGPEALIESFEVLHKCNGVVTTGLARSTAMFAAGSSEPIRLEDVFEEYLYSFDNREIYLSMLDGRYPLSNSVRRYGHWSGLYLESVHRIQNGDPVEEVFDPREGKFISVQQLRHKIRVPLRGSFAEGDFKSEDPDTEAVWSPPYEDGKDWSDTILEEEDDIRYWPELKDEELKDSACEDVEQEKEVEDIKVRKAEMNVTKYSSPVVRSSIYRFSTAATSLPSSGIGCIGKPGLIEGLCSGGLNTLNRYQSFPAALGRITSTEVRGNTFWRPQGLCGWRMVQMATRSLKRFL